MFDFADIRQAELMRFTVASRHFLAAQKIFFLDGKIKALENAFWHDKPPITFEMYQETIIELEAFIPYLERAISVRRSPELIGLLEQLLKVAQGVLPDLIQAWKTYDGRKELVADVHNLLLEYLIKPPQKEIPKKKIVAINASYRSFMLKEEITESDVGEMESHIWDLYSYIEDTYPELRLKLEGELAHLEALALVLGKG